LIGLYFARFLSLRLLTWDMVLGPTREIGLVFELRDCVAKKKSGSLIPIHPSTWASVRNLALRSRRKASSFWIILLLVSGRTDHGPTRMRSRVGPRLLRP
jgi:hypothetical protein